MKKVGRIGSDWRRITRSQRRIDESSTAGVRRKGATIGSVAERESDGSIQYLPSVDGAVNHPIIIGGSPTGRYGR